MPAFRSAFLLPQDMNYPTPIESQSSSDMGNPSPLWHWMDTPIMPCTEDSPIFQHPDGQFYPLGMAMPMYDGEGRGYFSEIDLASSFCANVDSGSPSCLMDYTCSPEMMQFFDRDTTDYTSSQGEVSFDFSGFPIDESTNVSLTGEGVDLVSTEAYHNSCWDHPLEMSSQRPETMADPDLSWPDILIDSLISPGFISSLSLSMSSLSRSFYTEDGVNQPRIAQPSSAGQTPEVQRNFIHSPSPVPTQPATTNTKEYQDQILMEDRRNGWSYKKIRTVRNFGVTESTLRGRYRNLTKSSHERPRSPTWTEKDVHLLKIAVPRFTVTAGSRGVSWKAVSEFIQTHGDSPYAFAYATCKKKWVKLTKPASEIVTPNV
ncbi:hypothetical protein E4U30_007092 [Claviceps sp. LM220 group G6]|nr:hypothetical protein E4U30_007092 [Claviceps sp. LM220 group G6]